MEPKQHRLEDKQPGQPNHNPVTLVSDHDGLHDGVPLHASSLERRPSKNRIWRQGRPPALQFAETRSEVACNGAFYCGAKILYKQEIFFRKQCCKNKCLKTLQGCGDTEQAMLYSLPGKLNPIRLRVSESCSANLNSSMSAMMT